MLRCPFETTLPLPPLTFDRVNQGRQYCSSFPLFKLPPELFGSVTLYLSRHDLASLAMVDRSCCQLARSVQFANIKLDGSKRALGLLARLKDEVEGSWSNLPTIGSCVRRLVVANDEEGPEASSMQHRQHFFYIPDEERRQHISSAREMVSAYLTAIFAAITQALPNLHTLEWNRITQMSPHMVCSIAASGIKYLRLFRVTVNQTDQVPFLSTPRVQRWELETLFINSFGVFQDGSGSDCFNTILRQSAPTLRELVWNGGSLTGSASIHPKIDGHLTFPHLRQLFLHSVKMDCTTFNTLLGPGTGVRSLSVDSTDKGLSELLCLQGQILILDSFRWIKHREDSHDNVLTFIESNPQLRSVDIAQALPASLIDSLLLPNFARFHYLTSLGLAWDGRFITKDSLHSLGLITTLNHLLLSTGNQRGWRHDWEIDHRTILDALRPLRFLKSLVFTRDSYSVNGHPLLNSNTEGYYINNVLPVDVQLADYMDDGEMNFFQVDTLGIDGALTARGKLLTLAWERWHQSCMVALTREYAAWFPNLEWCYLGQLSMRIEGLVGQQTIILENEQRDTCSKFLEAKWNQK